MGRCDPGPPRPPAPPLPDLLQEWVVAGLISPDQARASRDHEGRGPRAGAGPAPVAAPPTVGSLVVEALGYLGGVIMLVGAVLLASLFWEDLLTGVRLALIGLAACALVAAGVAVPERLGDAAARLRSVLWALAVAATGTFMVVFTDDVLDRQDETSLLVVGPCTAAVALVNCGGGAATWLQQLALLVPVVLTALGIGFQSRDRQLVRPAAWSGSWPWPGLPRRGPVGSGRASPACSSVAWSPPSAGWRSTTTSASPGAADRGGPGRAGAPGAQPAVARRRRLLAAVRRPAGRGHVVPRTGCPPRSRSIVTGGLLVAAAVWVARHQGRGEGNATGADPKADPLRGCETRASQRP